MEEEGKNKKAKQIVDKYRFSEFRKLNEQDKNRAFEELYKLNKELLIDNEVLNGENLRLKKTEEKKVHKPDYSEYDPNWKGIEKVIYILKENGRVMLSKEIVLELLNVEPDLAQKWDSPYSATIKYISRGVSFGRIIQYNKIGSGGFTYALPEWFDENGALIKKFLFT